MSEKSKIEAAEHQDDSDIHYQPFPELVSEEREIYTDDNGRHRHHVKRDRYLSAHYQIAFGLLATLEVPATAPDETFIRSRSFRWDVSPSSANRRRRTATT